MHQILAELGRFETFLKFLFLLQFTSLQAETKYIDIPFILPFFIIALSCIRVHHENMPI